MLAFQDVPEGTEFGMFRCCSGRKLSLPSWMSLRVQSLVCFQVLFREGAIPAFLDVPEGTEFGMFSGVVQGGSYPCLHGCP